MNARMLGGLLLALCLLHGCEFGTAPGGGGTGADGLTGILVDSRGGPVGGARVRVYPDPGAALSKAGRTGAASPAPESTMTDATGRFRFRSLADGRYNLEASFSRNDTLLAVFNPGIDFVKSLDLGADTLRMTGSVVLRIRGAENAPVAGAECSIAGSPWKTLSDAAGTCTLTGLAPGSYRVSVTVSGAVTVTDSVTLAAGQSVDGGEIVVESGEEAPPTRPTLLYPPQGALLDFSPVNFSWSSQAGVSTSLTDYRVQVATDSLFGSLVVDDSVAPPPPPVSAAPSLKVGSLQAGATYYWRVIARGPGGSAVSERRSFATLAVTSGTPPVVPPLQSPAASATGVSRTPAFSWTSWTGAANTDYYRLQVSTDSLFGSWAVNDTVLRQNRQTGLTGVTLKDSLNGGTLYFWRVIGIGPGGATLSETRRFTTLAGPPAAVPLYMPHNGDTVALSPELSWGVYYNPLGIESYRVQVSLDSLFSALVVDDSLATAPSLNDEGVHAHAVGPLSSGTRYYWRILSVGSSGSTSSQVGNFIPMGTRPLVVP